MTWLTINWRWNIQITCVRVSHSTNHIIIYWIVFRYIWIENCIFELTSVETLVIVETKLCDYKLLNYIEFCFSQRGKTQYSLIKLTHFFWWLCEHRTDWYGAISVSKLCGIEILLGSVYTASSKRRGVHTIERQNQEPNPTGNISLTLDSKRQLVVFALHVLLSNNKSLEMALELITN